MILITHLTSLPLSSLICQMQVRTALSSTSNRGVNERRHLEWSLAHQSPYKTHSQTRSAKPDRMGPSAIKRNKGVVEATTWMNLEKVKALVTQSCLTFVDCSPRGSSILGIVQATILGRHSFLQGIFLTQKPNPGLLHGRQILYRLSHRCVKSKKPVTEDCILSDFIYMKCPGKSMRWEVDHQLLRGGRRQGAEGVESNSMAAQ